MNRLLNTLLLGIFVIPIILVGQDVNDLVPQNKKMVKITGYIEDAQEDAQITFRFYKDYITFEEIAFDATIDEGYFSLEIPIYASTPGFVEYQSNSVPIFIESGDDLLLRSYHSHFTDSLKYSHKGALRNNYLKESFIQFDKQDTEVTKEGMSQHTSENFAHFMEIHKQEKQQFLASYLTNRDTFFSKDFEKYIEADILYWWGQNMFQYKDSHPASHILPVSLNLPDKFYAFVESLELNNEEVLNNSNYLKYLDHYMEWRQDRIEKGLLKVSGKPTQNRQVAISRIETFAEVLMHDLQVREHAHDGNSIIAKLKQKDKILYLRDVTNDKFRYTYNGQNYIDRFVKIQLPDGRKGWVFSMGVRTFEDVVSEYVSLDIPKEAEDYINKIKYSSFRGKVLHYAVSKDIYNDLKVGKRVTKSELDSYIKTSPYGDYVGIIRDAYTKRKYNQPASASSLRGTANEQKVADQINKFTKNLINLLELAEVEQQTETPPTEEITITEEPTITEEVTDVKEKSIPSFNSPTPIAKEKASPTVPPTPPVLTPKAAALTEVSITPASFAPYQQKTHLRFKTNFSSSDKPSVIYNQNPFLNDLQERKLGAMTTGRSFITFSTDLATPSYWQLKNKTQRIHLYFEPGDDIKVEITGSDIYTQTTFSGSNSAENSYLIAQAAAFQHIEEELKQQIEVATPMAFKAWMVDIRQQKLDFYYQRMQGLSPAFLSYAEADINYWYAYNLMNYLYEHPLLNDEDFPMEAPVGYLDFMNHISIHNDAALPNKNYILYIQEYLAHVQRQPQNKGRNRYQLADEYLSGRTKDFLSVITLSLDAKMPKKRAALSHQIKKFETTSLDGVYVEFVKKAFHEAKGLTEGMMAPGFSLVDQYGKTVRLNDLKGKVILLDFWATWCGPCIDLMPTHRSLQEKYKGKDIAFVYVSMDNKTSIWKNYLQNKRLGGQHLISDEAMGFKSPISKDYQIKYLPYTLLLDTNGTIVWKRTGGFSVSTVTKIIDQLLYVK